jgi:hypothetical protein
VPSPSEPSGLVRRALKRVRRHRVWASTASFEQRRRDGRTRPAPVRVARAGIGSPRSRPARGAIARGAARSPRAVAEASDAALAGVR